MLRALWALVRAGVLIRLGYGVYAKTRDNPLAPGEKMLAAGFSDTVRAALRVHGRAEGLWWLDIEELARSRAGVSC